MEAENQQVKEIIQPLLDAENGLVKVRRWTFMVLGFQGNVDLCVCNCCAGYHLGVGEFSESTGCGRAAEEGAAAQALDWACVVPPSEEGGGACVQV